MSVRIWISRRLSIVLFLPSCSFPTPESIIIKSSCYIPAQFASLSRLLFRSLYNNKKQKKIFFFCNSQSSCIWNVSLLDAFCLRLAVLNESVYFSVLSLPLPFFFFFLYFFLCLCTEKLNQPFQINWLLSFLLFIQSVALHPVVCSGWHTWTVHRPIREGSVYYSRINFPS